MAFSRLCSVFRRAYKCRHFSTRHDTDVRTRANFPSNLASLLIQCNNDTVSKVDSEFRVKFAPRTLNVDFDLPMDNGVKNIIEMPSRNTYSIEIPKERLPLRYDGPVSDKTLDLPAQNIIEKQAVRMIKIRQKKMKKHKRKKLRRKMKNIWAKIRQRREIAKEKAFQLEQVKLIQEAEKFDAAKYVLERLEILNRKILPRTWMGEILPADMIKNFIEEKKAKKEAKKNRVRLKF